MSGVAFLIAPSERPPISTMGPSSSLPEKTGADILWECKPGKLAGVQRKEISDLIASVRNKDKRLGRELVQMKEHLAVAFLLIEGIPQWDRDGNLMNQYQQWTMKQQFGVELSAQRQGVFVVHTRSAMETVRMVEYLAKWTMEDEHAASSLLYRPAQKNGWGKLTDKATAIHILSGMPNIGVEFAARIYDAFGRVPCRHDIADGQLEAIEGIGPKRAAQIRKVLGVSGSAGGQG